ncbi:hypothetical protein FQR65_LT17874 [Abscondita terminalis]|nr:hypothetical protein FQR65_LT17874 [Abscondita terminalis]
MKIGGSYWENPDLLISTLPTRVIIEKWNKPIMIVQGGLDFRVSYEQGQEAFQAAKLKGLKAKMLYFPNENHWVLHPHNALDDILADEITVNVFSKVLTKLDLFDSGFQFKTWILTIAQNTIIDYWRKKSRDAEDATGDLEEVKNVFVKSPEELMISEEENEEIFANA